jgi:steroid 5-alpha reductase family enzyme
MGRDARFDKFRKKLISFLFFWVVQAVSIFIISLSFLIFYDINNGVAHPVFWIGISIALIGLIIESVADYQKFQFKKSNPDTFIQSGLWKTIRHPNYTGEILFWVGVFVTTTSYISGWQWIAVLSPLWIIFLLLRFSGIPPLEEKWAEKYGDNPQFIKYKNDSDKLIPGIY